MAAIETEYHLAAKGYNNGQQKGKSNQGRYFDVRDVNSSTKKPQETMWETDQADEARFLLATLESFQTGRVTPLLKEELRYKIQSRRLSEGKNELDVNISDSDTDSKEYSLRPDEIEKNERRKEQNRRAAAKFRRKQKTETKALSQLVLELDRKNTELKQTVAKLQTERDDLRAEVVKILNKDPWTG